MKYKETGCTNPEIKEHTCTLTANQTPHFNNVKPPPITVNIISSGAEATPNQLGLASLSTSLLDSTCGGANDWGISNTQNPRHIFLLYKLAGKIATKQGGTLNHSAW
jgi:hypothetical protein